jgi:4-hydroxybenzoate polyprenyltransferase
MTSSSTRQGSIVLLALALLALALSFVSWSASSTTLETVVSAILTTSAGLVTGWIVGRDFDPLRRRSRASREAVAADDEKPDLCV